MSIFSSYFPTEGSTVGKEAMFLIDGFLEGRYPSKTCSALFESNTPEWYRDKLEIDTDDEVQMEIVEVSNIEQFYEAISSNKEIRVKPGEYQLDVLTDTKKKNPYVILGTEENEFIIKDVRNLSIVGLGEKKVNIVTNNMVSDVLVLENVKNFRMSNIRLGHSPKKAGCFGGVISFISSENIYIEDSSFFGCGTIGLELYTVKEASFNNVTIEECSAHILRIEKSAGITFQNSSFLNNIGSDLININGSKKVIFDKCSITGNVGKCDSGVLFDIGDTGYYSDFISGYIDESDDTDILIKDSIIKSNITTSPDIVRISEPDEGCIKFENTLFEGNSFSDPES